MRLRLPHPLLLLIGAVAAAMIATWIIPAGTYQRKTDQASGREVVVAGTYQRVEQAPVGPTAAVIAIPRGIISGADVILTILFVGAAFALLDSTGALARIVASLVGSGAPPRLVVVCISIGFAILGGLENMDSEIIALAGEARGPERMLDLQIRISPHGDHYGTHPDGWTLARLREHPKGVDLGPLEPRLPGFLATDSGRIDLAPDHILGDVGRLHARLDRPESDGLVMIGRRHLRSNNSWLHNVEVLVKGRDRCTLLVHPDDAAARGLVDGGSARITSSAGSVVAPVEVSDEVLPGVVSLPHGWGHDLEGVRLGVARRYAGVNANLLVPGDLVDGPSATHAVNGFPVTVQPA